MIVCSILLGLSWRTSPSRLYSRRRGVPAGGSLASSISTVLAIRLTTIRSPLRSTMSPRGAWMRTSRTWLELAWETYWSPESTCRYHSRKKTTANSTSATPPITATRNAIDGLIGGGRASGSWITTAARGPGGRGGGGGGASRAATGGP